MKDLTELKEKIVSTESVKQLVQILGSETKDHIRLEGLKGAINSFLIAYGHSAHQKNFLIIAEEKESAAYLLNDLENINADNKPLFFPDSFKRPAYFEVLNKTNVLQRTETVNKFTQSSAPKIIVSYPEALFEKVVAPEILQENQMIITKGE